MPEWMTLEFRPVWWSARRGSRSTTATVRPVRTTAWAVARPTIPPPTTTTSYLPLAFTVTIMAGELAGQAGPGQDRDHADDQGEGEGQRDAGPVAEAVGPAGHDGAGHAGADGLAEDVEQLQARGGPALQARGGPVQGGHRQRRVGLADAEAGDGPGGDAQRRRHRRQQGDPHQHQAGEHQPLPQPD